MAENKQVVSQETIKEAAVLLRSVRDENARLEKVAGAYELEKRATKIAFREVALGVSEPYKTYEELQEKVASLLQEDLDVVEKALDRGYPGAKRDGALDSETAVKGMNPLESWVRTGELT